MKTSIRFAPSLSFVGLLAVGCVASWSRAGKAPAPAASRIDVAVTPHAPETVNPFLGARAYIAPRQAPGAAWLASSCPGQPELRAPGLRLATAVWLDSIARVPSVSCHLEEAARQEATGRQPVVAVFVLHDLPLRDCAAPAPTGELGADDEGRYQHEFIDAIAARFRAQPARRIVVIVEPNWLANLTAGLSIQACAEAASIYRRGVAYAVARLSLPNVFVYLDAADGGVPGWRQHLPKMVENYRTVLATAGGPDRIRGFAVDVARDGSRSRSVAVGAAGLCETAVADQAMYVEDLRRALAAGGMGDKGFIVGVGGAPRTVPPEHPRVAPAATIDAYLWDTAGAPGEPRRPWNSPGSSGTAGVGWGPGPEKLTAVNVQNACK